MKRKINFAPIIIILGIFAALFWFVPYIWAVGISSPDMSYSYYNPYIKHENAPDGTVYLDILVKLDPSSEDYTDFN